MLETTEAVTSKRIKLLSADVASKIAAGEVVERPASVLKELLENSIDAGATKIDIYIEHGGIQAITIIDNGNGIQREDLALALQQHATSKINDEKDLASITSLGFRGEALASINSVAKLSITSQTAQQKHAWRIKQDQIVPAAHPVGTTVQIQDLFYNVPARRKFLRSARTEYLYLEETFRRIALSNFNVAFTFTNQGKLIKNLPACKDQAARTRRLSKLCGPQLVANSLTIDAEQNGLQLWGWLGAVHAARSQEPHQYFFINGRVIKDRLINHAIRQVYQPFCADGKMPFYCLYLQLDPIALDVNVHPTKHEVRFRDARIIHAFITQILAATLSNVESANPSFNNEIFTTNNFNWSNLATDPKILCILEDRIIVAQHMQKLLLIDLIQLRKEILLQQLLANHHAIELPTMQTVHLGNLSLDEAMLNWCKQFGLKLDYLGAQKLIVRALPNVLLQHKINWLALLEQLKLLCHKQTAKPEVFAVITGHIECAPLGFDAAQKLLTPNLLQQNKNLCKEFSAAQLQTLLE